MSPVAIVRRLPARQLLPPGLPVRLEPLHRRLPHRRLGRREPPPRPVLRDVHRRVLPGTRASSGPGAPAQGLASGTEAGTCWRCSRPIALIVLIVLANHGFGAPLPTSDQLADWPQVPVTFLVMLVFVGIGEEAGWMAFAAPILLRRHSLLVAWVLASAMRILWHLPLMLSGDLGWVLGTVGNAALHHGDAAAGAGQRRPAGPSSAVWHASLNATSGLFFFTMVTGPTTPGSGLPDGRCLRARRDRRPTSPAAAPQPARPLGRCRPSDRPHQRRPRRAHHRRKPMTDSTPGSAPTAGRTRRPPVVASITQDGLAVLHAIGAGTLPLPPAVQDAGHRAGRGRARPGHVPARPG